MENCVTNFNNTHVSEPVLYNTPKPRGCDHNFQCFPKVARVADHFNIVADQLPHFARPNDPQNLN